MCDELSIKLRLFASSVFKKKLFCFFIQGGIDGTESLLAGAAVFFRQSFVPVFHTSDRTILHSISM